MSDFAIACICGAAVLVILGFFLIAIACDSPNGMEALGRFFRALFSGERSRLEKLECEVEALAARLHALEHAGPEVETLGARVRGLEEAIARRFEGQG